MRPRGAFRWRKGCEGDGEQEESVRGWRDGADGRNAKDVRDWTVVSKGDVTGHEKSGAIGNRRARAGGGGRAHHRRRGVCCRARDPAARAAGPAKGDWGRRLPGADGRGEMAGRTVRPRRPRLRQHRLCAGSWHALPGLIPTRAYESAMRGQLREQRPAPHRRRTGVPHAQGTNSERLSPGRSLSRGEGRHGVGRPWEQPGGGRGARSGLRADRRRAEPPIRGAGRLLQWVVENGGTWKAGWGVGKGRAVAL